MDHRYLLKHAVEIKKTTFRKLIAVDTPAFIVERGEGWHLSLYRGECGALCACWSAVTGAPQYYIIDISA